MKKILAILMCLSICFSFAGCGKENTENQNKQAKEVLMKVLTNEQTFIAKTLVFSDKPTEQKLEKYYFQTIDNAHYSFSPAYYTFADCDEDGIDELVILHADLSSYLILRYDNEKVYGYNYDRIGDIKKFKADGSFEPEIKDEEQTIARLEFNGYGFEIAEKAYINEAENKYLLDGKSKDKDTVKKYFDDWNKNIPKADWVKIDV